MTAAAPKVSRDSRRRQSRRPIHVTPPATLDYPNFAFDILHRDLVSKARVGRLTTPHGIIETPNYIFCGTKASVKNLSPAQMVEARTDIILANTYHLLIQPGPDVIEKMGGLHKFMQWPGPMMTDSGGFQIFSMGNGSMADEIKGRGRNKRESSLRKITEEGAKFRSYKDGALLNLTPESAIEIQRQLGADLIYQFDECTAYHDSREYTGASMERSLRWGDRCLVEFARTHTGKQALYGIVQGGVYEDFRRRSSQRVAEQPFFGTAVGGCLGGSDAEMQEVVGWSLEHAAPERPVHFLGIGRIRDVFMFVRQGIDTFDCVSPTRIARHGWALMRGQADEKINLRNAVFRDDPEPLDPTLDIAASRDFSKAYLHHLLKADEMLGMQLVSQHNVAVMNRLMREVRTAIRAGNLDALEKEWRGEQA